MKILPILILSLSTLLSYADPIKTKTVIQISIKGVPAEDASQINGEYSVYANGNIKLPYLDNVRASGKTPEQLASHIRSLYKNSEIFTNPTVNVHNPTSQEVQDKIITFISDSGSRVIPFRREMTLQTAIAAAGGAGTFDSRRYAFVERNGQTKKYDLKNEQDRNLKIYPNDVVRLPHANDGIWKKINPFGR